MSGTARYRPSASGDSENLGSDPFFPKAKEAVEIKESGTLSLMDRRLFTHLLAIAYPQLTVSDTFSTHISVLLKTAGGGARSGNDRLKVSIAALQKTLVTFFDGRKWKQTQLLGSCEIEGGMLTFSFSRMLMPYLVDPAQYSRISLRVLYHFQCKYSIPLYEKLNMYVGRHHKVCDLSLDEVRQFLGVKESQYTEFAQLKRRVIQPALIEIERYSRIHVTSWAPERCGRSVKSINFVVRMKDQSEMAEVLKNQKLDMPLLAEMQNLPRSGTSASSCLG